MKIGHNMRYLLRSLSMDNSVLSNRLSIDHKTHKEIVAVRIDHGNRWELQASFDLQETGAYVLVLTNPNWAHPSYWLLMRRDKDAAEKAGAIPMKIIETKDDNGTLLDIQSEKVYSELEYVQLYKQPTT